MSDEFEVRGAEDFLRLSKALKHAGKTEIRKGLHKGLREGAKPLAKDAQKGLEAVLPSGLQGRGSKVKVVVKVKTGTDPGVTLGVPFGKRGAGGLGASNARMLNAKGVFRHPVHADPKKTRTEWEWVNQLVPAALNWFDQAMTTGAPKVLPALERAMQSIADQIVREAGQ